MKPSDELIQKQTEAGTPPTNVEGEAYRLVFDALQKEPGYKLSSNFASKVAAKAMANRGFNWDKFFLISGCLCFVCAIIYVIASIQATFTVSDLSYVSGYSGLLLFAIFFIALLNWVDRKWIKKSTVA